MVLLRIFSFLYLFIVLNHRYLIHIWKVSEIIEIYRVFFSIADSHRLIWVWFEKKKITPKSKLNGSPSSLNNVVHTMKSCKLNQLVKWATFMGCVLISTQPHIYCVTYTLWNCVRALNNVSLNRFSISLYPIQFQFLCVCVSFNRIQVEMGAMSGVIVKEINLCLYCWRSLSKCIHMASR